MARKEGVQWHGESTARLSGPGPLKPEPSSAQTEMADPARPETCPQLSRGPNVLSLRANATGRGRLRFPSAQLRAGAGSGLAQTLSLESA